MIKRLFANLVDEVAVLAISGILLGLGILILKVIGFSLTNPLYVALVIVAVIYLLYYPIIETILKKSLGKKIFKLD